MSFIKELCPTFIFHSKETVFPCSKEKMQNVPHLIPECPMYFFHDIDSHHVTFVIMYEFDTGIHNIGSHKTDIEFVRVYYDDNKKPVRYYLSQHGRDQGMYLNYDKMQKNMNDRVNVYVAKGTHAHYPRKSIWVRGFCFANDITGDAFTWNPSQFIEINDPQEIEQQFGKGRMQWSAKTEDIIGAPTNHIINTLFRFYLPLSSKLRKMR